MAPDGGNIGVGDRKVEERGEVPEPERTQVTEVVNVELVRSEGSGGA